MSSNWRISSLLRTSKKTFIQFFYFSPHCHTLVQTCWSYNITATVISIFLCCFNFLFVCNWTCQTSRKYNQNQNLYCLIIGKVNLKKPSLFYYECLYKITTRCFVKTYLNPLLQEEMPPQRIPVKLTYLKLLHPWKVVYWDLYPNTWGHKTCTGFSSIVSSNWDKREDCPIWNLLFKRISTARGWVNMRWVRVMFLSGNLLHLTEMACTRTTFRAFFTHLVMIWSMGFGQSISGGRFPLWTSHKSLYRWLEPLKGSRRLITSQRIIPQLYISHFSVYRLP